MAKKRDFEAGLDSYIKAQTMESESAVTGEPAVAEPVEEKPEEETRKMFSFRLEREVADTIRDFAFTKRMTIDEAVTLMVNKYMTEYLADPNNEPLLKVKRKPRKKPGPKKASKENE